MRQAREALLGLLACQTGGWEAGALANAVVQLALTAEDMRQAREALLGLLAGQTDGREAGELADAVAQLDPTAEDKRQAREALLGLLAGQTDDWVAEELERSAVQFDPTVRDLIAWRSWVVSPTEGLLAMVRRNSALAEWLATLPSLTSLTRSTR